MNLLTKPGLRIGLLLILSLIFGPGLSTSAAQGDPASAIFGLVNEYRASLGLPSFQYNAALASAAQSHANWMAANVIYSHTGAGGSTPLSRATAAGYYGAVVENIVGGMSMSPNQGLIWWQNSPTHLNTLISTRYYEAGTGFATNGTQNMFVLVVGRQAEGEPPAPSSGSETSAAPIFVTPIELAKPREDGSIVHELQQGQALWTIAAYYDVDLDHLYLINSLSIDDILQPGYEVIVRLAEGQSPPPSPTPPLTHIVREGDSPWAIAGRYGLTVDDFFLLNGLGPESTLNPGDQVIIRLAEGQAPLPTPTPRTLHVVQQGDSAWSIAANYNLTLEELQEINALSPDTVLRPGDELLIRPPTATPQFTPTVTKPPEATLVPAAPAPAEDGPAATLSATPIAVAVDLLERTPQPQPSPQVASSVQNQDAGSGGTSWLLIAAVALGIAGLATLIIARRQH